MTERGRAAFRLLLPPLFCLWLYWYGLRAWFQQDDFAWLGLRLQVQNWHDLLNAMFAPLAQGTIRPWSERAFFLGFGALFGLDALPFRIWVFLTQFANLALAGWMTRRLTGSRAAAALAPVLWAANPGMAVPMSWTSAYNQVLCAFFLLLAFCLFVRYAETGRAGFYRAQWVVFLAGFGALELNVVYPGIALAYAGMRRSRKLAWKAAAMVPVSAAYALLHRAVAPAAEGAYGMHWDWSMAATFWKYWQWAPAAARTGIVHHVPGWFGPAGTAVFTGALLGFVFWKGRRSERLGWFCVAWFVVTVAPVLPLRDHAMDYYLAIPSLGLAVLGAWGVVTAFRHSAASAAGVSALAALYLWSGVPLDRAVARWHFERGRAVEAMTMGVERAHELHPEKLILLEGVGDELFWGGVYDHPFRLVGANDVYLAPRSEKAIRGRAGVELVGSYVLGVAEARRALEEQRVVVYQVGGRRLRNVTSYYEEHAGEAWSAEAPRFVDAGQTVFSDLFGREWSPMEGGQRWMGRRAGLRMGGPRRAGEKLFVAGYWPEAQGRRGRQRLLVRAAGVPLRAVELRVPGQFEAALDLPASAAGVEWMALEVEVDGTDPGASGTETKAVAFRRFAVH